MTTSAAPVLRDSTVAEIDRVGRLAARASQEWDDVGRERRAVVLEAMADAVQGARDPIIACADAETALGFAALSTELQRTTHQLRFFAAVVRQGGYLEAEIEHATTGPLGPIPDLRRMLVPIGPVAVFGSSNFPLAFSVPGGDTASALAAGCAVVLKSHPSHPLTSALTFDVITAAAQLAGAPGGLLTLVRGLEAGRQLVRHPAMRAVAFTGSLAGGRTLANIAQARPAPIPFYGELGAANVVVVTVGAARDRGDRIGIELASSYTTRSGQMCTKPGIAFVPTGPDGDRVCATLAMQIAAMDGQRALNPEIAASYHRGVSAMSSVDGVSVLAGAASSGDGLMWPVALTLSAADFGPLLTEECFGPVLVVVRYAPDELMALLERAPSGLTATVQAGSDDNGLLTTLSRRMRGRVGRIVWNDYPTGVAVSTAMTHGGPWPATNTLHTSVGSAAIRRFLRPVTWQNAPEAVLPMELRDGTAGVPRRVDGAPESEPSDRARAVSSTDREGKS